MCMVFEEKQMEDSTDYMKICVLVLEHNLSPQIGHVLIEYVVYYYVHSNCVYICYMCHQILPKA